MIKKIVTIVFILSNMMLFAQPDKSRVISNFDANWKFALGDFPKAAKTKFKINTSVGKVWNAYTTPEGWKSWVTPVVEMDFKINGTIKSHYDSTATIGDKGTIVNHILNYIPYKLITMQAELNENFPAFVTGEEKNLYSIVDFYKLSENQTKLTIYGTGYKNEQQWIDLLKFFIHGNEMSLNKLKNYLE